MKNVFEKAAHRLEKDDIAVTNADLPVTCKQLAHVLVWLLPQLPPELGNEKEAVTRISHLISSVR